MFSTSLSVPKDRVLQYRNKHICSISHWKKCVDGNGSYFNKDVLEPSCNDLKFTAPSYNSFYTNLE